MLHGKKIIGEATLHQRVGGWKRHVGLITVLTHPEYRGRDVAKILVAGAGGGGAATGAAQAGGGIERREQGGHPGAGANRLPTLDANSPDTSWT